MSVFGVILVCIFAAFSCIRTEYGEIRCISPYSVRMRENVGKMRTRTTMNTDTFYAVSNLTSRVSNQAFDQFILSSSGVIFWLFPKKCVTPLISMKMFCLIKQQLQPLRATKFKNATTQAGFV